MTGIVTRSDVVKAVELKEGTLGISRGRRAFEERVSLTVELAMNFVLGQPVDDDLTWRAEFPGDAVRLMGQETGKAPSGRQAQRFTFQALKVGTYVICLLEVRSPSGTAGSAEGKTIRAATYTVTVSPPSQMQI